MCQPRRGTADARDRYRKCRSYGSDASTPNCGVPLESFRLVRCLAERALAHSPRTPAAVGVKNTILCGHGRAGKGSRACGRRIASPTLDLGPARALTGIVVARGREQFPALRFRLAVHTNLGRRFRKNRTNIDLCSSRDSCAEGNVITIVASNCVGRCVTLAPRRRPGDQGVLGVVRRNPRSTAARR